MSQTTGSVKSIDLAGTTYPVLADSDPSRDLGGLTAERTVLGDGTVSTKYMPKLWKLSGLSVSLDDADRSQENLQALIDGLEDFPITINYISGASYSGVGGIDGDLAKSAQSGAADIDLTGGGKLTKI